MATNESILTFGMTEGEKVMWRFREAVKNESLLSVADISFLAVAIDQILSGTPPKKALKIEKPHGRKEKTWGAFDKELGIAMRVIRLAREKKIKLSEAQKIVVEETGKAKRTIARYCAEHARFAKDLDALIVAYPKRHKQVLELVNNLGSVGVNVWHVSPTTVDSWIDALDKASFSEGYDLRTMIKSFLENPAPGGYADIRTKIKLILGKK